MSHTYSSNRIHVIFSTKERQKSISDELQPKLWAYMAGIARNQGFEAMIIGGVKDHVHALLLLPPSLPLSKAIQFLKGSSSKWLNETGAVGNKFSWQEGYGAFSVSASQTADVVRYIENQAAHHAHKKFRRRILGIPHEVRGGLRSGACFGMIAAAVVRQAPAQSAGRNN
ncbi:MAG TPA: IS200/IS605 family transposase [Terriglobales bacterium]|jgi:REP element-mobilizing transposase RayT|nr:IS200/IS605 family transposase [Terriglobales bacterium]